MRWWLGALVTRPLSIGLHPPHHAKQLAANLKQPITAPKGIQQKRKQTEFIEIVSDTNKPKRARSEFSCGVRPARKRVRLANDPFRYDSECCEIREVWMGGVLD